MRIRTANKRKRNKRERAEWHAAAGIVRGWVWYDEASRLKPEQTRFYSWRAE